VLSVVVAARGAGTISYAVAARAPAGTVPGPRRAAARISVAVRRDPPPTGGSTGTVTTVTTPTTTVTTTGPGTAADFAITSMTPAQAGQTVTVVVMNNGPSAAAFVARFAFANATAPAGSTDSGRYADGVWTSGAVEPGRFVSATIFTAKTGGPATITGTVVGALPDPDATNDTRSQSF
jgi:sugar (pentulose or hexulose) kinase